MKLGRSRVLTLASILCTVFILVVGMGGRCTLCPISTSSTRSQLALVNPSDIVNDDANVRLNDHSGYSLIVDRAGGDKGKAPAIQDKGKGKAPLVEGKGKAPITESVLDKGKNIIGSRTRTRTRSSSGAGSDRSSSSSPSPPSSPLHGKPLALPRRVAKNEFRAALAGPSQSGRGKSRRADRREAGYLADGESQFKHGEASYHGETPAQRIREPPTEPRIWHRLPAIWKPGQRRFRQPRHWRPPLEE